MIGKLPSVFGGGEQAEEQEREVSEAEIKKLRDNEAEILDGDLDEEVLGTGHTRLELKRDLRKRQEHLWELKDQILEHWEEYQHYLGHLQQDRGGILNLESKARAVEAKKAAKDKEQLFKLLWKEYAATKNALRKDEKMQILSGRDYNMSFTEMDTLEMEEEITAFESDMSQQNRKVERFNAELNRADADVELDFSDLEKDIPELAMSDADEDIQLFIEGDLPEAPAASMSEDEWS